MHVGERERAEGKRQVSVKRVRNSTVWFLVGIGVHLKISKNTPFCLLIGIITNTINSLTN